MRDFEILITVIKLNIKRKPQLVAIDKTPIY